MRSSVDRPRWLAPQYPILALAPLNGLVYLVLSDPGGAFGPADVVTPVGLGLTGFLALGSAGVYLQSRILPRKAAFYALLLSFCAVLPILFLSPPDAVLWPVAALANVWMVQLCRLEDADHGSLAVPVTWLNLLVLVLILLFVGYELSQTLWTHLCLAILVALAVIEARFVLPPGSRGPMESRFWWLAMFLSLLLFVVRPSFAFTMIALGQIFLLWGVVRQLDLIVGILEGLYRRPAQMLALSFSGIIAVGTILLSFPVASAHAPIGFLDALFTATSATCVTGLIVLDTPVDFSTFGHVVLLVLIQVGGLGMITISSFASLFLGHRIGLRAEAALGTLYEADRPAVLFSLIRFIVLGTLAIELVGALFLANVFLKQGYGLATSCWYGLFHSVSAFCNAGFALFSDSLVGLRGSVPGLLTISLLILVGGIGFGVLSLFYRRLIGMAEVGPTPIHVRLSLLGTLALVVVGTLVYGLLEWDASLGGLPLQDRVLNAFFQSVTCRTAGFNSVAYGTLQSATIFFMMLLMFVGACSNSTGGGVKVTTIMVLLAAVVSTIRGREEVEVMGRTIPVATVYKATVVITLSLLFVSGGVLLLLATQSGSFPSLVFEAFSAVATVGLSLGTTGLLDSFGKLVIIVLMFIGRIGPLTLVLLLESKSRLAYRLPHGNVLVG